jgi:tetrapyrrole methylase family protein / MazG family protein
MIPVITIVGLGPGASGLLTAEARGLLASGHVFLRTRRHPAVTSIPESSDWESFDARFERPEDLGGLRARIAEALLTEAKHSPLVYAVPGHPLVGDATVAALLQEAARTETPVGIVPGISALDAGLFVLPAGAFATIQVVDALDLAAAAVRQPFSGGTVPITPLRPALITQCCAPPVIAAAKQALLRLYPGETSIDVISATRAVEERAEQLPLHLLDQCSADSLMTLYLPALDPLQDGRASEALQQIVARLRAPGGCPWDREQTHQSIKRHLIEEAYEAVDALERGDPHDIREELGDVLLQVYLHAQMAEESGNFALEDIFGSLTSKLIRRHPHVFGNVTAETAGAVLENWDQIKRRERRERGVQEEQPLGRIPVDLPALSRAQTVLRRAQRAGIESPTVPKLDETLAHVFSGSQPPDQSIIADALFALTAAAAEANIDAEQALREVIQQFEAEAGRSIAGSGVDHSASGHAGQTASDGMKGDPSA